MVQFKARPLLFAMNAPGGIVFMVIVKVFGMPLHPFNEGVTVIEAVTGDEPVLIGLNGAISPVPLAARPILVLSLVQV
jgi:hypothetical protein